MNERVPEAHEEAKRRWEQKNGPVAIWAINYLTWKPSALAWGRLSSRRAAEIEHILAWSFYEYTEVEMDSVRAEIDRFMQMHLIDEEIQRIISPDEWRWGPSMVDRPSPSNS